MKICLDAELARFFARRRELLALSYVGGEVTLASVGVLQPFEDDRGVEPAGIGEHDFLHFAFHFFTFRAIEIPSTLFACAAVLRLVQTTLCGPSITRRDFSRGGGKTVP